MTDKVSAAERSRINAAPRRAGTGRRSLGRTGVVAAAAAAALIAGTVAAGATPIAAGGAGSHGAASASPQRIGAVPHLPKGSVRIGTTPSSTQVELSVGLLPRDEQALKDFVTATTTKGNAQYHQYLSKGQFATTFGPTADTVAKVTAELKAEGLNPGKVSSDGLAIPVTTTLAKAQSVFSTGFTSYRLADGSSGFVNNAAPQVSGSIAADISGISGLNTVARRQALDTPPSLADQAAATTGKAATGTTTGKSAQLTTGGPQLCSSAVTALGKLSGNPTDGNGYISAGTLADTYGMEHTSTSGAGVTIGVFEMENYSDADLAAFQSCYGTKATVTRYKVDKGPTEPVFPAIINGKVTENGIESLLDLEDIVSLAPGAKVIDYQGADIDKYTDAKWLHIYQTMVTDDAASVLSISYGGCEYDTDTAVLNAEEYYSLEAASQGQTIFASSGDDGASGCINDTGSSAQNLNSVSDPASQLFVTGVGGTTLTGGSRDSAATDRTAWTGSGGGTSAAWELPVGTDNFQNGFNVVNSNSDDCQADPGYVCRQVPDIAADADYPNSPYALYFGGAWDVIGGTSGSSPTWAALTAIADTQAACKANGPLGWINPALYQAARTDYAGDFTDITVGDNRAHGSGYDAGPGYDLVTGLGEPKAAALSTALCAGLPAAAKGAGTYHPLTPTRLLDTRQVGDKTPVPTNGMTGVQITGNAGIPSTGVTSVVLNVTVTGTTGSGFLTAWGDGTPRPTTSNLNWTKGTTISNLVTVPVPGDGGIDFFVNSATHVIADVQGYYTDDTSGETLTTIAPTRFLDTRTTHKTAPASTVLSLKVRGVHGIPATAQAVVVNLTATGTGAAGFLAAYPGPAVPTVSNVNWSKKATTEAGLAIVPIASDGTIKIKISGSSQVIVDVPGYFSTGTGGAFSSVTPTRLLDTRPTAVAGGKTVSLQITGKAGIPTGIKAVVLNVTVTGSTGAGYLTGWASGTTKPGVSNLNWVKGQTIPNQVVVPVGADGKVDLYVNKTTNVIADVFGYFK